MNPAERKGNLRRWNHDPVVLLVDDEPGILNAVRRSLRDEPCEVITAGSSVEALGWLQEIPVDLIITDQRMPGMTGTELLQEVRRLYPRTARALLTGYRTPSTLRQGLEAGADTLLYKPWDDAHLVETVRRILASSGARRRRKEDPSGPASSFDLGGEAD
jgi:response regulator RpfG family c-di-GMP phosphodiesterase